MSNELKVITTYYLPLITDNLKKMLIVENLTYTIKKHTILKGINFVIRPGEMVGLLGANGAGKSSLIRLLNGEHTPTDGQVSLHGKNLKSYTATALSKIRATMAQQHHVSADFPVREVVMMGRYPHYQNHPQPADIEAVEQTMDLCGVTHLEDRSILSLSGGEKQRVHLARILA